MSNDERNLTNQCGNPMHIENYVQRGVYFTGQTMFQTVIGVQMPGNEPHTLSFDNDDEARAVLERALELLNTGGYS